MMLVQRWPDVLQPTTQNPFYYKNKWRWPNVGQMLFNQPYKNNFISAILYAGPTLALRCKANPIKGVAFQIFI